MSNKAGHVNLVSGKAHVACFLQHSVQRKYNFVLRINCALHVRCFFSPWKRSFLLTPYTLQKFCFETPSPSEFSLTFGEVGGGGHILDIFWKTTKCKHTTELRCKIFSSFVTHVYSKNVQSLYNASFKSKQTLYIYQLNGNR